MGDKRDPEEVRWCKDKKRKKEMGYDGRGNRRGKSMCK